MSGIHEQVVYKCNDNNKVENCGITFHEYLSVRAIRQ